MKIFKRTKQVSLMFIGAMILILSLIVACEAAPEEKAKSAKEKARMEAIERKRKIINAAKEQLNNTVWQIECTQTGSSKKKKSYKDTLRFVNGMVESEKLVAESFSPSNFTVRIKHETRVIWETMQRREDTGIAFWRGELKKDEDGNLRDVMRGAPSWSLNEKKKKDYVFVSVEKRIIDGKAKEKIEGRDTAAEKHIDEKE